MNCKLVVSLVTMFWLCLWLLGQRMMERPFTRPSVQVATVPAVKANLR